MYRKATATMMVLLWALPLLAQSSIGELRLIVTDPAGLGMKSTVEVVSEANEYRRTFTTDEEGRLDAKRLPFGAYWLGVHAEGFQTVSEMAEVRAAAPAEIEIKLSLSAVNTSVQVTDRETLIDSCRTGAVNRIGAETIATQQTSLPGRSLVELVNTQPGWVFEGNAVLHPRGSEYQTQFVVDGIPLTEDRSLGFASEIEADDVQSLTTYTAGIPAEYGRKMGGIVEVNTQKDSRQGFHGTLAGSGGSFALADGYALVQYGWSENALSASSSRATTNRYLNPPVVQNYTNSATTGNYAVQYEHDFNSDRLGISVRHDEANFLVPNEQIQQAAGQQQSHGNFATMGTVWYQHPLSQNVLIDLRGMVRDTAATLASNPFSIPIRADQDRGFREEYGKGSISIHHGVHEWKAGVEADFASIREAFNYAITSPAQFDPETPATFKFLGRGLDREQSAFVQDLIHWRDWTVNAGLRWDHYQLLVNEHGISPRVGVGKYFPKLDFQLHASYDRVFQTPALENILLSSSRDVLALNPNVLRLPVQPSRGNYYQVGATKGFHGKLKLDLNYFRRYWDNYADDDQLLNTGISFPTAFRNAVIYGAEAKLELPRWGPLSGFVSYSYLVGLASLPVVGGLLLGDDASNALTANAGRFSVTQDQRNTLRTRLQCRVKPRLWLAMGAAYDSGLPTEFTGTVQQAILQYGQALVDRVDLARGRVRPSYSVDASAGIGLHKTEKLAMTLQADVENVTNRLNVIDFAGLFSGTAVAPPRSYFLRFQTRF